MENEVMNEVETNEAVEVLDGNKDTSLVTLDSYEEPEVQEFEESEGLSRGEALAIGGAGLAVIGGIAYAVKKHNDKKKAKALEEPNGEQKPVKKGILERAMNRFGYEKMPKTVEADVVGTEATETKIESEEK